MPDQIHKTQPPPIPLLRQHPNLLGNKFKTHSSISLFLYLGQNASDNDMEKKLFFFRLWGYVDDFFDRFEKCVDLFCQ